MTRETDLAWAAGFIDGEGTCGCYRQKNHNSYRIRMGAKQIDRRVLDKLCSIVGVGKVNGPYSGSRKNDIYDWQLYGLDRITTVYELLSPYLGDVKKDQILGAIIDMERYNLIAHPPGEYDRYASRRK